jgi:hypothetical protein
MTGMPVLLPTIKPDQDFYEPYWDLVISTVILYGLGNVDQIMQTGGPDAFENLRAYLRLANQFKAMGQISPAMQGNQLPPGPPGEQEPGAKAGPVPVPAKPNAVKPLALQPASTQ